MDFTGIIDSIKAAALLVPAILELRFDFVSSVNDGNNTYPLAICEPDTNQLSGATLTQSNIYKFNLYLFDLIKQYDRDEQISKWNDLQLTIKQFLFAINSTCDIDLQNITIQFDKLRIGNDELIYVYVKGLEIKTVETFEMPEIPEIPN